MFELSLFKKIKVNLQKIIGMTLCNLPIIVKSLRITKTLSNRTFEFYFSFMLTKRH